MKKYALMSVVGFAVMVPSTLAEHKLDLQAEEEDDIFTRKD
jgi:hypothetical protein